MTPPHLVRPMRWVLIAWTIWIIILTIGTFWYANGRGPIRAILFLAITLPILAVWLVAWKKSEQADSDQCSVTPKDSD